MLLAPVDPLRRRKSVARAGLHFHEDDAVAIVRDEIDLAPPKAAVTFHDEIALPLEKLGCQGLAAAGQLDRFKSHGLHLRNTVRVQLRHPHEDAVMLTGPPPPWQGRDVNSLLQSLEKEGRATRWACRTRVAGRADTCKKRGDMALTAARFHSLFDAVTGGAVVPLDDPRIRKRQRECDKTAVLLSAERTRLRQMERHEREARQAGRGLVAGVDEVGRGPLAGPLVAAAVVFDEQPWIPMLDDSKRLSEDTREVLFDLVYAKAVGVSVAIIEVDELNRSNIHAASLLAMRRALEGLPQAPGLVLVDGCHAVPALPTAQKTLVKGDQLSLSIAAASIVAKVTRDRRMIELDARWPAYGFAQNKGYGTAEHLSALSREGPCPVHRTRFAPVAQCVDRQLRLFGDSP